MQYKRISADCHLDMIWLPPDLFTSEAPRELKERMPFADYCLGAPYRCLNESTGFRYLS